MPGFRWRLSDLPPHLREQAERQMSKAPQPRPKASRPEKKVGAPDRPHPASRRMSGTEDRFAHVFAPSMGWKVLMYEPCALWISAGFKYTPDFLVELEHGQLAFVETKGCFRLPSQSRSRLAFADACSRNPGFMFLWAKEKRKHAGFSVEHWRFGKKITPRPDEEKPARA